MSPSLSRKVFYATAALMTTWSTIRAGPADELIKKGDDCDLKLQAAEALDFYLAAGAQERKSPFADCTAVSPLNGRCHDARTETQARWCRIGLCAAGIGARAK